jgi:hypothetical protein
MAENVIVWDLETVPDLDAVARAYHLPELDVEVAREALGEKFPSCHRCAHHTLQLQLSPP